MICGLIHDKRQIMVACLIDITIEQLIKWQDLAIELLYNLWSPFGAQSNVTPHTLQQVSLDLGQVNHV